MALIAGGVGRVAVKRLVIAPQQRHRAAQRFQVVTPTAGSATINQQTRVAPAQLVPVSEVAFDVAHLRDALPVWGVIRPPIGQGIDIEILPVEINAFAPEHAIHMVGQPLARLGVAEVEQLLLAVRAEQPCRIIRIKERAGRDPLRLKPDNEPHALRMRQLADGPETVRVTHRIRSPCAGLRPVRAGIPAGVNPPVIEFHTRLREGSDELALSLLAGPEAGEEAAAARTQDGRRQFAIAGARQVVSEHPPPPHILCAHTVPLPELQRDQRRARFLPRVQPEPGQFLPAAHMQAVDGVARELGCPLARPADDDDEPFAGPLQVEVRKAHAGGPPAGGGETVLGFRLQRQPFGFVAAGAAIIPGMMVENELALTGARQDQIHRLEIRHDRRVLRAGVLEVYHPLDGREITILDANAAHLQAGGWIGPDGRPLRAVLVQLS